MADKLPYFFFFWLHINWWTLSFTDADFRGNVAIVIYNHSDQPFIVQAGSLMAYLICQKISCPEIQVLEQIEQTERADGGFGSTGWNKHDISRLFLFTPSMLLWSQFIFIILLSPGNKFWTGCNIFRIFIQGLHLNRIFQKYLLPS